MENLCIVVPVYNSGEYLRRCLDSILAQTFRDFKCIVVDDGSEDDSKKICQEYAKKDNRIYVLYQNRKGVSAARNKGLEYIFDNFSCEYIGFIDSDDWIHPQMYEILYKLLTEYNANMSVCSYKDVKNKDEGVGGNLVEKALEHSKILHQEEALESLFTTGNDMFGLVMPKLYKSVLFRNRRFEEGVIYEDVRSCYRVLYEAKDIAVTQCELYNYYYNPSSITKSKYTKKRLDIIPAMEEQISFFEECGYIKAYELGVRKYLYLLTYHGKLAHENLGDIEIDKMIKKRLKELFWKERKRCNITPMNSSDCYNALFPRIMHWYWRLYGVKEKLKHDT